MELKYPLSRHFSTTINYSYLHMKNKIIAAPEQMDYYGVNYHNGKWLATLGLKCVKNLYTLVGENETKEDFDLLIASVTYAATRNLSLWVRGENLLAEKYDLNLGYPRPRATFMGGISLSF